MRGKKKKNKARRKGYKPKRGRRSEKKKVMKVMEVRRGELWEQGKFEREEECKRVKFVGVLQMCP